MSMASTPAGREADHAAIERLSRAFGRVLQRYFEKRGVRKMDLEDAVQEVFARLSRREGFPSLAACRNTCSRPPPAWR